MRAGQSCPLCMRNCVGARQRPSRFAVYDDAGNGACGSGIAIQKHLPTVRDRCRDNSWASKIKRLGDQRASGCSAKRSRRCRTSRGGNRSTSSASLPVGDATFRRRNRGHPGERRHGKQAAICCCMFPADISDVISDVRTDRRARRGSRLLPAICQGGHQPGARSPGRSSLRRRRAGRPLVNGFCGSL